MIGVPTMLDVRPVFFYRQVPSTLSCQVAPLSGLVGKCRGEVGLLGTTFKLLLQTTSALLLLVLHT